MIGRGGEGRTLGGGKPRRNGAAETKAISRRRFLELSTGVVAAGLFGGAVAAERVPAIGLVVPNRAGHFPLQVSRDQVVGEAARRGAILAEEESSRRRGGWSSEASVFIASAADDASALRAARRLLALGEVFALVGGFSHVQSHSLARLAEDRQILFMNIGSSSDSLRDNSWGRNTFHVEASVSMYLESLVAWAGASGLRRWFLIYPDNDEGRARERSASKILKLTPTRSQVVGRAVVGQSDRDFAAALEAIETMRPEAILVLTDALGQLDFMGRYRAAGFTTELFGFPDSTSQTRMFYEASRRTVAENGWAVRAALWEATLAEHGAKALNDNFLSRWGRPMDPSAWAAYQSVNILSQLAASADSLRPQELIARLESPESKFDLQKGNPIGFRDSDHQLLQPIYTVQIEPGAQGLLELARLDPV